MKIKIIRPVLIKGELFLTDRIAEVENSLASELIANYKAVKVVEIEEEVKIETEDIINKKKVKTKKINLKQD